jgi:hypothetical protein
MKTIRGLASEVCKREGKKSQARIGDVREILGILSDILYAQDEPLETYQVLYKNGQVRSKKKSGKKQA